MTYAIVLGAIILVPCLAFAVHQFFVERTAKPTNLSTEE